MGTCEKVLLSIVVCFGFGILSLGFYSIYNETQIEQQKLAKHYSCLQILDSFDKN